MAPRIIRRVGEVRSLRSGELGIPPNLKFEV
jgi:hypothetical protein